MRANPRTIALVTSLRKRGWTFRRNKTFVGWQHRTTGEQWKRGGETLSAELDARQRKARRLVTPDFLTISPHLDLVTT